MSKVKVLKTKGSEKEILEKSQDNALVHLFITSLDSCSNHGMGDILINEESSTRFALIVKEYIDSKINLSALRLSIIYVLNELITNNVSFTSILISKHQISTNTNEIDFVCTLKEICTTYFNEVITDSLTLIISDCKSE